MPWLDRILNRPRVLTLPCPICRQPGTYTYQAERFASPRTIPITLTCGDAVAVKVTHAPIMTGRETR